MKDLNNVNPIEFQTIYMQQDKTTQAMCKALKEVYYKVSRSTFLAFFYGELDRLDDSVLDELAWQFDVDFYKSTLPRKSKVELIRNSNYIKQLKGTPAALERLLSSLFGKSKVKEWFDYNGKPYHFIVDIWNQNDVFDMLEIFFESIETVKNVRSVLEKVNIIYETEDRLYFGAGSVQSNDITIYPYSPDDIDIETEFNVESGIGSGYMEVTIA